MDIKKILRRYLVLGSLGLCATLLVAQPIIAQPDQEAPKEHKREGKAKRGDRLQQLAEQLNLTEDQKSALAPVFKDAREKGKAVRNNAELTPEQKREQMMQIRKDSNEKVNAILTEDQREKMKELRKQQKGQRGQREKKPA